jgi:hypothetical protein
MMRTHCTNLRCWSWFTTTVVTALTLGLLNGRGAGLSDGLVSYWPLDTVVGLKTPDLVSGYDMELQNLTADDVVEGRVGNAFQFDNARQTLLRRINSPGEQLPINQHPAVTVAFWANVTGTGQSDLRLFSEGSTTNNNPLFNLGTANTGDNGTLDIFFRQAPWAEVNHLRSVNEPLDGTWHHIAFVQQEDGSRALYIDGVLDPVEIPAKEEGPWNLNTTTIGGILRANPTHWVTGLIDEVALWSRALTPEEVEQVFNEGLVSVFPPLSRGMVAYWPLNEVVGLKTPEVVNGYDMELQNLTTADLVPGKFGMAFQFDNARQTLLRRINVPGEQLPVNQYPAITVALWANVVGTGQSDLRLFSEGSTTNNNPLFNLGTANTGDNGTLDIFFRQAPWADVNHLRSVAEPLDGTWHHIAFIQQEDGARAVYIDGVLDPVEIPAKEPGPWNLNTTTIGGILRANPTHWVSGQIDEVALWNRALDEAEIMSVVTNGVPVPFSRPQPLAIRSFASDFAAVAAGDSVVLRWDVTPSVDAELSDGTGGVINVSTNTVAGLGSIEVTLNESRTYTLTLRRGEETVSASIDVAAIADVADGWTLLDNFDRYEPGLITGNGTWLDLTSAGFSNVVLNGNVLLAGNGPTVGAVLPLRDLTVTEGQARTLFFRAYATVDFEPVRAEVVLTDRNVRFGDEVNNGPGAIISDEIAFVPMVGNANGFGGGIEYYEPVLEPMEVYNIWVDMTNGPLTEVDVGDFYSIHIQKDGDPTRTTIISDYAADRSPTGAADTGFTTPDLKSLVVLGRSGNGTTQNLLFDDFYLSKSGYLSTVPRAFGFTEPIPPSEPSGELTITRADAEIEVSWEGGTLESSTTVTGGWAPVAGATTSPYRTTPQGAQMFFRARQ